MQCCAALFVLGYRTPQLLVSDDVGRVAAFNLECTRANWLFSIAPSWLLSTASAAPLTTQDNKRRMKVRRRSMRCRMQLCWMPQSLCVTRLSQLWCTQMLCYMGNYVRACPVLQRGLCPRGWSTVQRFVKQNVVWSPVVRNHEFSFEVSVVQHRPRQRTATPYVQYHHLRTHISH